MDQGKKIRKIIIGLMIIFGIVLLSGALIAIGVFYFSVEQNPTFEKAKQDLEKLKRFNDLPEQPRGAPGQDKG